MEDTKRQFDGARTKLSTRFMAGRGQVLLQAINKPLQAQEFAKRRKLQEMLFKGEIKLEQINIPGELLPLNLATRTTKTQEIEEKPSRGGFVLHEQPQAGRNLTGFQTVPSSSDSWKTDSWSANSNQLNIKMDHSVNNSQSNWNNVDKEFLPKDLEKKNVAKPLRKPEKSKKKTLDTENAQSTALNSNAQGWSLTRNDQHKSKSPWLDWEDNVIVDGSLDDEDLPEIAAVEDNDDINDIVVNEYIDALQKDEQNDKTHMMENRKLTPQRVQQYSKLKSTSNADSLRVLPGTIPNPPKGDDRWGGTELNGSSLGWGDPVNNHRNAYDDGSSVWSSGGSQYGGMGWSNAS